MGRPSLYTPKSDGRRIQTLSLTTKGYELFEKARTQLKKLTNWKGTVSDGDVIEYLARDRKPPTTKERA